MRLGSVTISNSYIQRQRCQHCFSSVWQALTGVQKCQEFQLDIWLTVTQPPFGSHRFNDVGPQLASVILEEHSLLQWHCCRFTVNMIFPLPSFLPSPLTTPPAQTHTQTYLSVKKNIFLPTHSYLLTLQTAFELLRASIETTASRLRFICQQGVWTYTTQFDSRFNFYFCKKILNLFTGWICPNWNLIASSY